MTLPPPAYRAYLLRLWRTAEAHWHASLEDAHSGERLAFATLDQLADFLARETEGRPLIDGLPEAPVLKDNEGDRQPPN